MNKVRILVIYAVLAAVLTGCTKTVQPAEAGTFAAVQTNGKTDPAAGPEKEVVSDDLSSNPFYDDKGRLVYVSAVKDRETWLKIAGILDENASRGSRYLFPAENNKTVPPFFANINLYPLHYMILGQFFPEKYKGITQRQYTGKVIYAKEREFYTGNITERKSRTGSTFYTFTVWHHIYRQEEMLHLEKIIGIYDELKRRLPFDDLRFDPFSNLMRKNMVEWKNVPFRIYEREDLIEGYEAYTTGTAVGIVRFARTLDFEDGIIPGTFGSTDIIVTDESPFDSDAVVAGIITGSRQGELSHLNVRCAGRGTLNAYIRNPYVELASLENKFVKLELNKNTYEISEIRQDGIPLSEDRKPQPVILNKPLLENPKLADMTEIDVSTPEKRAAAAALYGAKAANMASLYRIIPARNRYKAFAIPFYWYDRFISENLSTFTFAGTNEKISIKEAIMRFLANENARKNETVKAGCLHEISAAFENGKLPEKLQDLLAAKIMDVWLDTSIMLRFRSSSNAEDSLYFSGAGLYKSRSGVIADDLDLNEEGPSLGDPDEPGEKTSAMAIKKVWASLWSVKAFNEREWYSINHSNAAMGILVNPRTKGEAAGIVAFSGNPGNGDDRFLINTQSGEADVVNPDPGVIPERTLVRRSADGHLEIERLSYSSLADTDVYLLKPKHLEKIIPLLELIKSKFPVDYTIPEGYSLIWDTEWKLLADGRFIVKQIRPFLRNDQGRL